MVGATATVISRMEEMMAGDRGMGEAEVQGGGAAEVQGGREEPTGLGEEVRTNSNYYSQN